VIHAVGVANGPSPVALADAYVAEQAAVRARIGDTPLSEIPSLAAWRRVFSGFGVKPTQYRSAAEALLRRLTKQGSIPSINALVDLGNLVAVRHAVPVAVFDLESIVGGTEVRLATGAEPFTDLGTDTITHPEEGEVVFADDTGKVSARRWCWRQSSESAAGADTTEVLITVEGHHEGAEDDIALALGDLLDMLGRYHRPAEVRSAQVSARSAASPW
jgi:DNA/RNA-binding domain of Phe-tRNA-synthetase-like protein